MPLHIPLIQVPAVPQSMHIRPFVPQKRAFVCPSAWQMGTVVPMRQQPIGHDEPSHVHIWLGEQYVPDPHIRQAAPLSPHASFVVPPRHWLPGEQHPFGQDVPLQRHVPAMHCWPL